MVSKAECDAAYKKVTGEDMPLMHVTPEFQDDNYLDTLCNQHGCSGNERTMLSRCRDICKNPNNDRRSKDVKDAECINDKMMYFSIASKDTSVESIKCNPLAKNNPNLSRKLLKKIKKHLKKSCLYVAKYNKWNDNFEIKPVFQGKRLSELHNDKKKLLSDKKNLEDELEKYVRNIEQINSKLLGKIKEIQDIEEDMKNVNINNYAFEKLKKDKL